MFKLIGTGDLVRILPFVSFSSTSSFAIACRVVQEGINSCEAVSQYQSHANTGKTIKIHSNQQATMQS